MTREHARDRFGLVYFFGWLLALATPLVDLPRAADLTLAGVWLAILARYGGWWLVLAIRDGSLGRALPEYGWAFLSLLLIAGACAVLTVPVLLVAGEPIEPTSVSSGAALGTFAFLLVWWTVRRPRGRKGVERRGRLTQ